MNLHYEAIRETNLNNKPNKSKPNKPNKSKPNKPNKFYLSNKPNWANDPQKGPAWKFGPMQKFLGGLLEILNYSFIGDWWVLSNFAKS
jgi:hypothetical protein